MRKAVYMKDTVYLYLSALIAISVDLCEKIRKVSFPVPNGILSDSESYCNKCIKETEKAFIPPLDREDIVYIALRLHRLNTKLYSFARLTESRGKSFDTTETAHILEHTKTVCLMLSDILKRKFKGKKCQANEGLSPTFTAVFPPYNNKYNFYSMISDYTLFKTVSECSDEAESILDYTVRTLVKNS